MTCDEQQQRISALIDAEIAPEDARAVFQHLAECAACRSFHHRLIALGNTLDRCADPIPAGGLPDSFRKNSPAVTVPLRWWGRRVSLGMPAFALLLCMILGGILIAVRFLSQANQAETVYVAKLPAVIITAEGGRP